MNFKRNTVIISQSTNPFVNTAFGKYLVSKYKDCSSNKNILFLSTSHHGVFIGKHQNCWAECNIKNMQRDKIELIRRDTGGGACYVDKGNRLFSFINRIDTISTYPIIISALNNLGIKAEMKGRNDIMVGDKKISGSAFNIVGNIVKHHGTILYNVDKEKLSMYLTPSISKMQSKGINSVDARVANLVEFKNDLKMEDIDGALIESFNTTNNDRAEVVYVDEQIEDPEFHLYLKYFKDPFYIYNRNPATMIHWSHKFSFGIFEFHLGFLAETVIDECQIFTDCLDTSFVKIIEKMFIGKSLPMNSKDLKEFRQQVLDIYDGDNTDQIVEIFEWLKIKTK